MPGHEVTERRCCSKFRSVGITLHGAICSGHNDFHDACTGLHQLSDWVVFWCSLPQWHISVTEWHMVHAH